MSEEHPMSSEQLVQLKWKTGMCPILNGIIFGDGAIVELETYRSSSEDLLQVRIRRNTDVEDFSTNHADYWTETISLCELQISDKDLEIIGGEGGFGSDGFVAVSRVSDGYLIWIAFFEDSNPFIQLSVNNNCSEILGITTLGKIWQFPIEHPEQVKIIT